MSESLRRLVPLLPLLALLATAAWPTAPASAGTTPHRVACRDAQLVPSVANAARIRRATLCLLNRERVRHGRPRLRAQRALGRAAARYAAAMVREGFFGHVSPGGSTMAARIRATSYLRSARRWALGENLARGAGAGATPARIVAAWMASPGHRRTILDARFRDIGVGVVLGAPARRAIAAPATYVTELGAR